VHQVLSYTRLHQDSQTENVANKYNINLIEYFAMLHKYGPIYLNEKEYQRLVRNRYRRYYREIAQNLIKKKSHDILKFQRKKMSKFNIRFSNINLVKAILFEFTDKVFNPKRTITSILRTKKSDEKNFQ